MAGVVTASVALFWAYEGWHQLAFSAAELRDPHRNLPRGLICGLLILIVTYLAVNAVFLHAVPAAEMRALERPRRPGHPGARRAGLLPQWTAGAGREPRAAGHGGGAMSSAPASRARTSSAKELCGSCSR